MADAILSQSGIYKITNRINSKLYVGSAVNFAARWRVHLHHLRNSRHHSPRLQNAWNKYGEEAFEFSIIEVVQVKAEIISREQFWLDALEAAGKSGYNASPTAGSRLGMKLSKEALTALRKRMISPEMREKLRAAREGFRHSEASIDRMRKAKKGQLNPIEAMQKCWQANIGRKHPPEFGEKIRARMSGNVVSAETRAKQSATRTGMQQSQDAKDKKSAALKGRPRPPEVIAKIIATKLRKKLEKEVSI